MIQRTLVLIKPEGVQRHLVGKIIQRFEEAGLKIVAMKQIWIDKEFTKKHYFDIAERHGEQILNQLIDYVTIGPVIAMVLESSSAVENVRKLVGPTEPRACLPGTIRGDFCHGSYKNFDDKKTAVRNVVHASGNEKEAKQEIELWFSPKEIHTYKTVQDLLM
jgi:nucleoside-diphosphate kinase